MGRLTTHVLDTAQGVPGRGIRLELHLCEAEGRRLLKKAVTNRDGRCDAPLLEDEALRAGIYELSFSVGDYYAAAGFARERPSFLDVVVLRFGVARPEEHYHVPLLVSPYGYSTYRGS